MDGWMNFGWMGVNAGMNVYSRIFTVCNSNGTVTWSTSPPWPSGRARKCPSPSTRSASCWCRITFASSRWAEMTFQSLRTNGAPGIPESFMLLQRIITEFLSSAFDCQEFFHLSRTRFRRCEGNRIPAWFPPSTMLLAAMLRSFQLWLRV